MYNSISLDFAEYKAPKPPSHPIPPSNPTPNSSQKVGHVTLRPKVNRRGKEPGSDGLSTLSPSTLETNGTREREGTREGERGGGREKRKEAGREERGGGVSDEARLRKHV